MFMRYTFCSSELMYTKCVQNVCVQNYTTFPQTFVYILYTKFSWHISFDFIYKRYTNVCRNVVYILYTFCIATFCIHQLYKCCIQNVYTVFVWDESTSFDTFNCFL